MARKLLTAIDQIEATAIIQSTAFKAIEFMKESLEIMQLKAMIASTEYTAVQFLYKEHLIETFTISELAHQIPIISPQERQAILNKILTPPIEEQQLLTKRQITLQQQTEQQTTRRILTRLEKRLQEVQEHLASPIALNLIDHTALCMLDKLLWETNPTIVSQITQQLVEMCEKKTSRLQPLTGYEALQEHMLQLYVPYFMTFPFTLNMFAVRLSLLTRQALLNKSMTLYYTGATQAQAVKQKQQLMACEMRRLETKCVASGKPIGEAIPEKFSVGWTPHLTEEEKVGLIKDMKGKELPFMALRYAYSIPYWLRRFIAIHMGYPENAKYALYFGIGGLPTRRSTWRYDFLKYPEAKYLQYSADEHIRNLIRKIQSKRGHFIKRYGKYYKRRRM